MDRSTTHTTQSHGERSTSTWMETDLGFSRTAFAQQAPALRLATSSKSRATPADRAREGGAPFLSYHDQDSGQKSSPASHPPRRNVFVRIACGRHTSHCSNTQPRVIWSKARKPERRQIRWLCRVRSSVGAASVPDGRSRTCEMWPSRLARGAIIWSGHLVVLSDAIASQQRSSGSLQPFGRLGGFHAWQAQRIKFRDGE